MQAKRETSKASHKYNASCVSDSGSSFQTQRPQETVQRRCGSSFQTHPQQDTGSKERQQRTRGDMLPTHIPLRRTIFSTLLHSNTSTHATPFAHERDRRAKGAWGNDCAYGKPSLTRPRILQSLYCAPMNGSSFVSHPPQEHALRRCGPTPRGVFASGGATQARRGSDAGATRRDQSRTRTKVCHTNILGHRGFRCTYA